MALERPSHRQDDPSMQHYAVSRLSACLL